MTHFALHLQPGSFNQYKVGDRVRHTVNNTTAKVIGLDVAMGGYIIVQYLTNAKTVQLVTVAENWERL